MWDTARRGGFTTYGRVDNQTLVVPRERLAMAAPGYEAMYGRPFRSGHPAAKLMGSFLGSVMPVLSTLDVAARTAVADAALDIARAVVATREDPQPPQQSAARLTAVRLYIDANLGNPSLSPATIAKANAISIRTLHRMFESTEDSVAEVAAAVGYGSEAAFNRAFKREFDCPPAQFRRKRKAAPVQHS